MPQTGYTPIQIYSSSTPTNAPSAGNLTNDTKGSELAINIADKNLFFKDSSNVVNTVPIRQSGAASDGWLSSTDWNTFNNKQPAGTYVTSVTGTAPVVSSGGTTPAISMAAATTSVNGYLTSTDWNTFNGKQAALVSGTNIKTVSGTSLLGSGDLGTIGTGYGGTGLTSFTANAILYASSTSALATSANLTFSGNVLSVTGAGSGLYTGGYAGSNSIGAGPNLNIAGGAGQSIALQVGASGTADIWVYASSWTKALSISNAGITSNSDITSGGAVYTTQVGPNSGNLSLRAGGTNVGTLTSSGIFTLTGSAAFTEYYTSTTYDGAIGQANYVVSGAAASGAIGIASAGALYFGSGGTTERMRLFASGGLSLGNTTDPGATNLSVTGTGKFGTTVGVGAATPAASGAGITFPATQSASSDANTLDDYEEGTFTPTIVYSGTNTPSYASQLGRYTKIGRIVQVQIWLSWNENGSTGNVTVGALPFTSVTSNVRAVPSIFSFGLTGLPTNVSATGFVNSNATTIFLCLNDNAATTLSATYTTADQDMYLTVTYEAA